jgi:ribosomal protein L44E
MTDIRDIEAFRLCISSHRHHQPRNIKRRGEEGVEKREERRGERRGEGKGGEEKMKREKTKKEEKREEIYQIYGYLKRLK